MDITPEMVAHAKLAIASFAGGAVRVFLRPIAGANATARLLKSVWCVFCCVTCGFYAAPVVVDWLGLTGDGWREGMGALIGLIGLSLAEGLLKAADGFDLKSWLLKLLTRNEA